MHFYLGQLIIYSHFCTFFSIRGLIFQALPSKSFFLYSIFSKISKKGYFVFTYLIYLIFACKSLFQWSISINKYRVTHISINSKSRLLNTWFHRCFSWQSITMCIIWWTYGHLGICCRVTLTYFVLNYQRNHHYKFKMYRTI